MKRNQRIVSSVVIIVAIVGAARLMQRDGAQAARIGAVSEPVQSASAGLVPAIPVAVTAPVTIPNPAPVNMDPQIRLAAATTDAVIPLMLQATPAMADETRDVVAEIADPAAMIPATTEAVAPQMPRPPEGAQAPSVLPQTGILLQQRMTGIATPEMAAPVPAQPKRNEFGLTCGVIVSASERQAATVNLTVTAPCRGNERITVRHGDLAFSARISALGSYSVQIPALYPDAVFTVTFADGETSETQIEIPTANQIDRVVLLSQGRTGLQIHALEFGADYGDAGHVWSGAPRDTASAIRAGGGFLTRLGDDALTDGLLAEVYSFPANTQNRDGVVRLSIETEVTASNCGQEISGQSMQKQADGTLRTVNLTLAVPDCDAIGEFLVLKNLLRDLKVASN